MLLIGGQTKRGGGGKNRKGIPPGLKPRAACVVKAGDQSPAYQINQDHDRDQHVALLGRFAASDWSDAAHWRSDKTRGLKPRAAWVVGAGDKSPAYRMNPRPAG